MSATSKKTLYLDWLQLKQLSFKSSSNTNIPSSFVLTAKGDGTTYFTSVSSINQIGFTDITVPGQNTLNSNTTLHLSSFGQDITYSTNSVSSLLYIGTNISGSLASTMKNILSYPSFTSSLIYTGNTGIKPLAPLTVGSSDANFTSLQFDASRLIQYINPNGSTRMFLDYYPTFLFSPVVAPSSISSTSLFPEGNSNLKSIINISSHMYYINSGSNISINPSGVQKYIPITSFYGCGVSSQSRYTSNVFNQGMKLQLDTSVLYSNTVTTYNIVHYVSSSVVVKNINGGVNVTSTGLEDPNVNIITPVMNSLFVTINNSANTA